MHIREQYGLLIVVLLFLLVMPYGSARAQVEVTSADPSAAPQGTLSLDVAINGSGFDNTAQVQFLVTGTTNPGGITVKKVVAKGPKKLIATIDISDTAVIDKFDIEVTLSSGRKGKGTTLFTVQPKTNGDPCAAPGLDFPAFTYGTSSGATQEILVADATGTCSRSLFLVTDGYDGSSSTAFSHPIGGSANRGRVIWREGTNIVGGDFTVSGTTVTVEPRRIFMSSVDCCALELSPDGQHMYVSTSGSGLYKVSVANPADRVLVKTTEDGDWFFEHVTANGDESMLYVAETRRGDDIIRRLIRVNLDSLESTLLVPNGITSFWAAADPSSNLVVYTDYVVGSNNCYLLQVIDGITGVALSYGQPRYGRNSSWYGGKILTNGRKPPKGAGRCDATDSITEIDPLTSAERTLTRGYDPDGR